MAWPLIKEGRIQSLIHIGLVGHHLIRFAQECGQGTESASFYSTKGTKGKNTGLRFNRVSVSHSGHDSDTSVREIADLIMRVEPGV